MKTFNFKIKRLDPEKDRAPCWQEFTVELEQTERLLDGLIRIKDSIDGSLTFRRSCAHGICGSCAMKINGRNGLACQTLAQEMPGTITLEPLGAYPVIKDLVVDMTPFFDKNEKVMPYLVNNAPPPERERLQDPEDQHKILDSITCIMCGSCTSSCPGYWVNRAYLGPSALLKAYRFMFDTRDDASGERLEKIIGNNGLWRCHSIYNCVEVCPKEIDITGHLLKLKRLAVREKLFRKKKR